MLILEENEEAARGAQGAVRACRDLLDLFLIGATAAQGDDAERQIRGSDLQVPADLDGELARWRNDQRAGGSVELRNIGIIEDAIEKRYTEAVGLSHAGAGLTNEVLAIESDGERELLDGEGVRNPVVSEGIADLYSDAELGKGRGFAGIAGRFRGKHTLIVEDVAIVGPLERRGRRPHGTD